MLETRQAEPKAAFWETLLKFYNDHRDIFYLWLAWRLALLIFPFLAWTLFPNIWPPESTSLPKMWGDRMIWSWTRWDGDWYKDIAAQGYWSESSVAFYPLFPHLIRWFGFVMALGHPGLAVYKVAGLLISSLASLVNCLLLYRLAAIEYKDEQVARTGVLYLLIFPTAFFMIAPYTESLFLALALGAFYAARTNRWWVALLLATLAVLTKNQGVVVPLALLVEFIHQRGWNWRRNWRWWPAFGLPFLPLLGWIVWIAIGLGRSNTFFSAQSYWKRYFSWPWQTMSDAFVHLFQDKDSLVEQNLRTPFMDLLLAVAFILLLIPAIWLTTRVKLRPAYLLYFALCLVIPMFAPSSFSILHAMPRYLLVIFPAYFLLALAGTRWKLFNYCYVAVSLPLLTLLTARFILGYWVA
ncbi:MAG TPA: mannosyltransferase family protein [Chloroflexia bacterium]|nr:mannosyltransferase family protein [Chloroflexia bacterium]